MLISLNFPGIIWNILGTIDYQDIYADKMTKEQAIGMEIDILPDVLKNYTRKTPQ